MESLSLQQIAILSSVALFTAVCLGVLFIAPVWDNITEKIFSDLSKRMRNVRLDITKLSTFLRIWGAALFGTFFVLFFILQQYFLPFIVAYILFKIPYIWIEHLLQKRRALLRDQMVGASIGLANAVRAGLSLGQGLEAISPETPEPLSLELQTIVGEWSCGRPLEKSLHEVKERLELDSFTLFSVALIACMERGGKITEALERISHSLSENQRLERKLDADTSSGRKGVQVLCGIAILALGGFLLVDTNSTILFFTSIKGQLVFTGIIAIVYIAIRWCAKILMVEM